MSKFLASKKNRETADIILAGAPFDSTSSFRSGQRFAPEMIRLYSDSIETYSPYLDKDLENVNFYDDGDINIIPGDISSSLSNIEKYITSIINNNKLPFTIGGEHLISYPVLKALKNKYTNITVIQFDAHTDLRDEYLGLKLSHATVMKRILELDNIDLIQIGIRSGTKEEFEFARKHNTIFSPEDSAKINELITNKNVYITVDIDVFDPAFVPGVGNPESGGIDFLSFISFIKKLNIHLLTGIDVVELIPNIDSTHTSTIFTAKLIRELLLII